MKTILQKLGMLGIMLLAAVSVYAYDFEADGIYYSILSSENPTVAVTSGDYQYTGNVIVPTEVKFENQTYSVISIGEYAFAYCHAMKTFVAGSGLKVIGQDAFYDCESLISFTSNAIVPPVCNGSVFSGVYCCTLYVPSGCVDDYRFANEWGALFSIF